MAIVAAAGEVVLHARNGYGLRHRGREDDAHEAGREVKRGAGSAENQLAPAVREPDGIGSW